MKVSLASCELVGAEILKVNLRGYIPNEITKDFLLNFREVSDVICTLAKKSWETIRIIKTEIVQKIKNFAQIVLTLKKEPVSFSQLEFHSLSYKGTLEISDKLKKTNSFDASILAANYAVQNELPAVVITFLENGEQKSVRIINYNIYKKDIRPGDNRIFIKYILKTGCLLMK